MIENILITQHVLAVLVHVLYRELLQTIIYKHLQKKNFKRKYRGCYSLHFKINVMLKC